MCRVRDAGVCRAELSTLRLLIDADALGASVGVDGMGSADGLIGASRPAVPAVPGDGSASLCDDFVSHSSQVYIKSEENKRP